MSLCVAQEGGLECVCVGSCVIRGMEVVRKVVVVVVVVVVVCVWCVCSLLPHFLSSFVSLFTLSFFSGSSLS